MTLVDARGSGTRLVRTLSTRRSVGELEALVPRVLALSASSLVGYDEIAVDGRTLTLVSPAPLGPTWAGTVAAGAPPTSIDAVEGVVQLLRGLGRAHAVGLGHGALSTRDVHLGPDGAQLAWVGALDLAGESVDPRDDVAAALALLDGVTGLRGVGGGSVGTLVRSLRRARAVAEEAAAMLGAELGHLWSDREWTSPPRRPRWRLDDPGVDLHDPSDEPELFRARDRRTSVRAATPLWAELWELGDGPRVLSDLPASPTRRPWPRGPLVALAGSTTALLVASAALVLQGAWSAPKPRPAASHLPAPVTSVLLPRSAPTEAPPVVPTPLLPVARSVPAVVVEPGEAPFPSPARSSALRAHLAPYGTSVLPLLRALTACGLDPGRGATSTHVTTYDVGGVEVDRERLGLSPARAAALVDEVRRAPTGCPHPVLSETFGPARWSVTADPSTQEGEAAVWLLRTQPAGAAVHVAVRAVAQGLDVWVTVGGDDVADLAALAEVVAAGQAS